MLSGRLLYHGPTVKASGNVGNEGLIGREREDHRFGFRRTAIFRRYQADLGLLLALGLEQPAWRLQGNMPRLDFFPLWCETNITRRIPRERFSALFCVYDWLLSSTAVIMTAAVWRSRSQEGLLALEGDGAEGPLCSNSATDIIWWPWKHSHVDIA